MTLRQTMRKRTITMPRLQADAARAFFLSRSGQRRGIFAALLSVAAEKAADGAKDERSQQAIIDWYDRRPGRCIGEDRPRRDGIEKDVDQHGTAAKHQGPQHPARSPIYPVPSSSFQPSCLEKDVVETRTKPQKYSVPWQNRQTALSSGVLPP